MAGFVWTAWNRAHAASHGISNADAEYVVMTDEDPVEIGEGKLLAWGPTPKGRLIQVVYLFADDVEKLDWADANVSEIDWGDPARFYIIHARPLTKNERVKFKRRKKSP